MNRFRNAQAREPQSVHLGPHVFEGFDVVF